MNKKRITACICAILVTLSTFSQAYAAAAPFALPSKTEENSKSSSNNENVGSSKAENQTLDLTAESAVSYGLAHNKSIDILENKIQLAIIASQNASSNAKKLTDAEVTLEEASDALFDKQKELTAAKAQYEKAVAALSMGVSPVSIEIPLPDGTKLSIAAGSKITGEYADQIKQVIKTQLDATKTKLDTSESSLVQAKDMLDAKEEEFKAVLSDASETLDAKISYGSLIALDADDASKLMKTMSDVNLDVTKYAKGIYKNQIAMLIQKNYYDALYAEKLYELKKVAMDRGEKQYKMVKLSYDNGMKSKDDLLLSKMYYDGTVISCRLAETTLNNAITELKENMNLDLSVKITLQDSMLTEVSEENLEVGLKSGLTNRLEIQQTLGQLAIYKLNEEILNSRPEYRAKQKGIKEAKLLREGAELQLEKTKTTISSEITQSYETMQATGDMLKSSENLVKDAEEVVKIASLKYEQGFGAENSLLKNMDLEESSGTIIELVAAQEKLSDVEAQVAQIRYSYTMAKIKYQNDAGILKYE